MLSQRDFETSGAPPTGFVAELIHGPLPALDPEQVFTLMSIFDEYSGILTAATHGLEDSPSIWDEAFAIGFVST